MKIEGTINGRELTNENCQATVISIPWRGILITTDKGDTIKLIMSDDERQIYAQQLWSLGTNGK